MVIIKKFLHTQRQAVKSKKAFVSVLAIVLSLLLTISVVFVAVPAVSAKGESPFQDNECIFIDLRNFTGWEDDGAEFRVFTFYNDSDDPNFCHEFEENFANDNWYTGSNVLQKGIKADKFCDHVYRFRIPSDKISHVRIARTDTNANNKWNLSPYMWDNQRSKTAGAKSNCIKITGWDNSATWTTFSPTNNASYNEKSATPDTTITGNSNLYTIDATFYDYYNDDEIQKGWQNINYESNHASVHYTNNNQWYWWAGYWEPFQFLNSKIAAKGGNYPLYFGNFYGKADGYTGEGASNLKSFNNKANNSNNIGGTHKSVAGLTGGTLDSDGDIVYATSNGYNSSTKVPFFDKSFLSSNKVGSVVNSKFPMRKETTNGVTTYYFDSTSGKDNVWLNNLNTSSPTVSYASSSKRAKDSLFSYSNQEASGWGFFPFDGNRSGDIDAKDYGFGMRVDVKFNLGENGKINGQEQKFNFTGDDDVWVYVDGKLILDLGGDHKKASGSINFATLSVTADTGNTFNNATRNTNFTLENYNDPTAEHTLTMFYVERGMIESNLSFNFNFAPVGNEFIVDKTVNTANINAGIKSAVAAADTFSFYQPTANGKVSSKGTISNSTYTLKNGERINFQDQFTRGQSFTVTESESSPLDYTTTWSAKDLVMNQSRGSGNSKEATFTYDTSNSSEFAMTRVQLSYVNTPTVAPVTITKTVTGLNTGETDNTDFDGKVEVSLDNGSTWGTYPLTYTFNGSTYTLTSAGKLATNAKLRNGRTLTFAGLPQGAKVRFTEDATDVEHSFVSVKSGDTDISTSGMDVGESGNAITVTNQKLRPGEIHVTLKAKKTLSGADLSNGAFEFELLNSSKNVIQTTTCNNGGNITFDSITYSSAANDTYYIREKIPTTNDPDVKSYDTTEYRVTVNVVKNGLTLTPTVTYYKNNTVVNSAEFKNEVKLGEVYIVKEDNAGNNVTGAQFGIYKVSRFNESLTGKDPLQTARTQNMNVPYSTGTKQKTAVHFTNLSLYSDNTYYADPDEKDYQVYAIAEIDPGTGYFKNNTVYYFTLPVSGSYAPKYEFVNGHILSPDSGFEGMFGIKMLGIYAICFAALLCVAYTLFSKRKMKPARHRAKK